MAAFTSQSLTNSAAGRASPTHWIAPGGAALAGIAAAALCLLLPQDALEDWVWRSGLPALLTVAQPPLGTTARAVLSLGAATLAAAVTWSALFLLVGPEGVFARKGVSARGRASGDVAADGVPVLRRADAHPDAPARKPMSAADLGTPMPPPHRDPPVAPPPPVVQAIPVDLDQPLAAFHPGALPDVPREPVRPVAPLRPPVELAAGERIATVELPRSPAESDSAPSIESLLKRLEQSTRRPLRV